MSQYFLFLFIILLQISIFIHIKYIISYIKEKKLKYLKGFIITTVSNFFLGLSLISLVMLAPKSIQNINYNFLKIIEIVLSLVMAIFIIATRIRSKLRNQSQD